MVESFSRWQKIGSWILHLYQIHLKIFNFICSLRWRLQYNPLNWVENTYKMAHSQNLRKSLGASKSSNSININSICILLQRNTTKHSVGWDKREVSTLHTCWKDKEINKCHRQKLNSNNTACCLHFFFSVMQQFIYNHSTAYVWYSCDCRTFPNLIIFLYSITFEMLWYIINGICNSPIKCFG